MTRDWRKIFTEAHRGPAVTKEMNKLFSEETITVTREQFEQITVQTCSMILEEVESQRGEIV